MVCNFFFFFFFFFFLLILIGKNRKTDMVFGKIRLFLIGNGA